MKMMEILFAPLQGYTEAEYRLAHHRHLGGVDNYYIPFVRMEHGKLLRRDIRVLEQAEKDDSLIPQTPQIIASTPAEAAVTVCEILSHSLSHINVNMGCPFPPLAGRGKGAGILPHPDKVKALLYEVLDKADGAGATVSVKMRSGWEKMQESMHLLEILNPQPLTHIIMHPRLGRQGYKGECDMEAFDRFENECERPLYYNGDLLTPDDIASIENRYPHLKGVMMGRGLLANPALAVEYRNGAPMNEVARLGAIAKIHNDVYAACEARIEGGQSQLVKKMQAFWEYLLPDGDRKARKAIRKAITTDAYLRAVNVLLTPGE
jgi:hypothetical protein